MRLDPIDEGGPFELYIEHGRTSYGEKIPPSWNAPLLEEPGVDDRITHALHKAEFVDKAIVRRAGRANQHLTMMALNR